MKKILIILFLFPVFVYCQDIPLNEKKITTESMKRKDFNEKNKLDKIHQKKIEKQRKKEKKRLNMYPDNILGFVSNLQSCPFGVNYFNFKNKTFGWFIEYKTDFNVLAPGEWALRDKDWIINEMDGVATGNLSDAGYNVYTVGIAINFIKSRSTANIIFLGLGRSELEIFEEYAETYTGPYYAKAGVRNKTNFSIGYLRQTGGSMSWQFGIDTAVFGFTIGAGFVL